MFNHRSIALALVIVSSSILPATADAKAPVRHRSVAQVEAAKARMERDGTASISAPAQNSVAPAGRKSCSNISCLGYATMLGVGY